MGRKTRDSFTRIDYYTPKKVSKTLFIGKGRKVFLSWYPSNNFNELRDVRQCYGICFDNKNRILIVKNHNNMRGLPGGKPEKGENFEQTLKREINEEANTEIEKLIPIGYNKIEERVNGKKKVFYQLRFICDIKKVKKQKVDPATDFKFKRKFIKPDNFLDYVLWGKTGEAMIKRAIKIRKKKV